MSGVCLHLQGKLILCEETLQDCLVTNQVSMAGNLSFLPQYIVEITQISDYVALRLVCVAGINDQCACAILFTTLATTSRKFHHIIESDVIRNLSRLWPSKDCHVLLECQSFRV